MSQMDNYQRITEKQKPRNEVEKQERVLQAQQEFLNQLENGYDEQDAFVRAIKITTGDNDLEDEEQTTTYEGALIKTGSITPENVTAWLNLVPVALDVFDKLVTAVKHYMPQKQEDNIQESPNKIDIEG